MENKAKMTPKDFFLHLGVVVTLYVSTVAFITFLFALINTLFPSDVSYYTAANARSSMAWSLSFFVVVYPVMVYLLFLLGKHFRDNKEQMQLAIRKWFISLTIFLTAVTIIVDLVTLLTTFLQGESITTAFLLKVLVVIIVALTIFWLSLRELKQNFIANKKALARNVYIVSAVVLVAIVVGFFFMGTPQEARRALYDQERVDDLTMIQNEIVEYWRTTGELPASLETLNDPVRYIEVPVDPVTEASYGYTAINELTFELCADFATEQDASESQVPKYGFFGDTTEYFSHGIGYTCFERTINPDRIPRNDTVTPQVVR